MIVTTTIYVTIEVPDDVEQFGGEDSAYTQGHRAARRIEQLVEDYGLSLNEDTKLVDIETDRVDFY